MSDGRTEEMPVPEGRTIDADSVADGRIVKAPVPVGRMDVGNTIPDETRADESTPVPVGTTTVADSLTDGITPVGRTEVGASMPDERMAEEATPVPEGTSSEDNPEIMEDRMGVALPLSEVGTAAEALSVAAAVPEVPKAVVMPTIIPVVGNVVAAMPDEATTPLVGRTMGPEEPALGADSTLLNGSDGSTDVGSTPVEPKRKLEAVEEMMNGPTIVELPVEPD